jgi:hypothetical protein
MNGSPLRVDEPQSARRRTLTLDWAGVSLFLVASPSKLLPALPVMFRTPSWSGHGGPRYRTGARMSAAMLAPYPIALCRDCKQDNR